MESLARSAVLLVLLLLSPLASAEVPSLVSLSGRLTGADGSPAAGPVALGFTLYNDSAAGAPLWSETQNGVALSNGVFSVLLGSVTPLNLTFNESYWIAITVNGELQNPRLRLAAAPYAVAANRSQNATFADRAGNATYANRAAVAEGLSCAGCVGAAALASGTATLLAQGWDACSPGQNASFVLVTPAQGFTEVRLYLFGEKALVYERADSYEKAVGVGNVSWTTAGGGVTDSSTIATSAAGSGSVSATSGGGAGGPFATAPHSHAIDQLFQHNHSITTQTASPGRTNATVNRTGGLPADAALFVDGTNRTGDVAWTARTPFQARDEMLNQTITAWTSNPGVHWLDVTCTSPGAVRFVVSAR